MDVETDNKATFFYLMIFMLIVVIVPFIPVVYIAAFLFGMILFLAAQHYKNVEFVRPLLGMSGAVFTLAALNLIMRYSGYEFPLYILSASISITCAGSAAAGPQTATGISSSGPCAQKM